ncbi:hypothetical protein OG741_13795 [Streptomyces sp. NBC_01410]|uniref:hypothetical protein n=1 Tax=Streptomyces sp. NBC_01410 TaxID=2903856 RepID=UPI00324A3DF1
MVLPAAQPLPAKNDPRLKGHETTYSASRGGWVKPTKKPAPGTTKKQPRAGH